MKAAQAADSGHRPNCTRPAACAAKGAGHCRSCHMKAYASSLAGDAARKAAWADPEVRARMSAASKAALADPEVRARMSDSQRRAAAKRAVQQAGLPLFRKTVDRARDLLDLGDCIEVVADALLQEARAAQGGERPQIGGAA